MVVMLLATCLGAVGLGDDPILEQVEEAEVRQVMATCLWRFARYVKWPEPNPDAPPRQFILGVIGDDPFGTILDTAVKDKKAAGRPIIVRRLPSMIRPPLTPERLEAVTRDIKQCHVLFIARSERKALTRILETCRSTPILTVSDIRGFARQDGMVEFVQVREQLGFHVNRAAYQQVKLQMDARLLKLAKRIYDEPR